MHSRLSCYGSLAIAKPPTYRRNGSRRNFVGPSIEIGRGEGSDPSSERPAFKILIVEDNRSFREGLSTSLQAHFPNLKLIKAARIQAVRDKVQSMQPDLIFVDVRLPDGSGLEFTRSLRAKGNKSVIIVLTNHDLPEYREEAFSSGADHFMVKGSVDINDILAILESILASRLAKRPR